MRNAGADRKTVARLPGREQPRHLSRVVWISAAIGALALHAGGVAIALGAMQPNEDDDDLGAPGIEIGVELMSPHLDPSNQPVGPDTTASMPSPEVVEQKQVEKQTDLPKAAPTETDDPDRTVSPTATQKPVKDDPTPATAQADPFASFPWPRSRPKCPRSRTRRNRRAPFPLRRERARARCVSV